MAPYSKGEFLLALPISEDTKAKPAFTIDGQRAPIFKAGNLLRVYDKIYFFTNQWCREVDAHMASQLMALGLVEELEKPEWPHWPLVVTLEGQLFSGYSIIYDPSYFTHRTWFSTNRKLKSRKYASGVDGKVPLFNNPWEVLKTLQSRKFSLDSASVIDECSEFGRKYLGGNRYLDINIWAVITNGGEFSLHGNADDDRWIVKDGDEIVGYTYTRPGYVSEVS